MSVGRRDFIVEKDNEEKALEKKVLQKKIYEANGLPSIASLIKQRELMMAAFRKGLACTMPVPTQVTLSNDETKKFYGRHLLADFIISDRVKKRLLAGGQPAETIKHVISMAAKHARATILNEMAFQQSPDGNIMGLVVIQESHLSIHFIPRENFLAVDVFTCGDIDFDAAIKYISSWLESTPVNQIEVKRGIVKDKRFVQGIGVQFDNNIQMLNPATIDILKPSLGKHVIMEFYLCNPMLLNDENHVSKIFRDAIRLGGGHVEGDFVHKFTPQGVSNAVIGSGRINLTAGGYCDLTVHNYPELEVINFGPYAAVDLCDFSNQINLSAVLRHVVKELGAEKASAHVFLRGAYQVDCNNNKVFTNRESEKVAEHMQRKMLC
jgi:S-adenosylmethionine decarboxylase proenzyme